MKKRNLYISLLVTATILTGLFSSTSCNKDRSMEAIITVKWMVDTMVVVPNCRVEMTKDDIKVVGYTDGRGEYRYTFEQPVQLEVKASNDSLSGVGVINLGDYGKDYSKSIFVF